MKCSILVAFNDSSSSRSALECLLNMPVSPEQSAITLVHIFRKPTGSEEMMGRKFMEKAPERIRSAMEKARDRLISAGYLPDRVSLKLVEKPYPSVADGIIDQFTKGDYNLVVIGRKKMSKAEEFVLGDTSIKLVRALEETAVMVVKQ